MRGDTRLINIKYPNGKVKRVPRSKAHDIVDKGQAEYISNKLYRAACHNVTVKPGATDAEIMTAIRKATVVVKVQPEPQKDKADREPKKRRRRQGRVN